MASANSKFSGGRVAQFADRFSSQGAGTRDRTWGLRASAVPAPCLVLQGRDDPFQPFEFYEMALQHVPTATLHFMDCGHYYHLELPDETEAVIRDFLLRPMSPAA